METKCVFCQIASGEIKTELVASSEHCIAFNDRQPRQPVHILVVPREHFVDVSELALKSPEVMADLMALGAKVAAQQTHGSHRFTFNTGIEAGQSVFHAHGHITSVRAK